MLSFAIGMKRSATYNILAVYSLTKVAHREHFSGILNYCCNKPDWQLHLCEPGDRFDAKSYYQPSGLPYDGYIVSLPGTSEAMTLLAKSDIPTVLINIDGRGLPRRERNYSTVWLDNESIGKLAAKHFLSQRRFASFAFVANGDGQFYNREREQSFRQALRKKGVHSVQVHENPFNRAELANFLDHLPKPTAIMCAGEPAALMVRASAREFALPLPGTVSILSVDAIFLGNEGDDISYIAPPFSAMGTAAAKELDRILHGNGRCAYREIVIPAHEIICRSSSTSDRHAFSTFDQAQAIQIADPKTCLRVGELANRLSLPRRTLQKHFEKITGVSCKTWLDRQRLTEAKKALLAGKSLQEAAENCGYRSANALTKAFRRLEGKSYREWCTELKSETIAEPPPHKATAHPKQ